MSSSPPPGQSARATGHTTLRTRSRRSVAMGTLACLPLATALILSGCGSGATTMSEAGSSDQVQGGMDSRADSPAAAGAGSDAVAKSLSEKPAGDKAAQGAAVGYAANQQLARTGTLYLQVKDATAAAARVRATATGAGGVVIEEKLATSNDSGHPITSGTVTISVPASALDDTLEKLATLGTVLNRTVSTEDVTATIVDTDSRVRTMTTSIERLRTFLAQSTKLDQVVTLEKELTQREADLESLKAQLADLKGRVAMAPVAVALTTDTGAQPEPAQEDGFLAGLKSGWTALIASTTALLTILGALLPFALVLAVVGIPLATWLRRRRPATTTPATTTPARTTPATPATATPATTTTAGAPGASGTGGQP